MSMKIVQPAFGGPETLVPAEAAVPSATDLAPGEVLVAVAAAGVNQIDVMTREGGGMAAVGIITLPFTPGWDVAGTVEAMGSEVNGLVVGQRVLGLARFPQEGAAYAEHAIVPAEDLVPTPENLTDEQAGGLPMEAMTAWQAFSDTTTVGPGQRVLITGAGGGVGHLAVQIGHHLGAHVIALGGGAGDLASQAEQVGIRFAATHVRTQRDWLESVVDLAGQGIITPTVSEVFDLADAAAAHQHLEAGHSTGKTVLRTTAQN